MIDYILLLDDNSKPNKRLIIVLIILEILSNFIDY